MAVNARHKQYDANKLRWKKCRDCAAGSDAVKEAGPLYLPLLDAHKDGNGQDYAAYRGRALFYNATGRTIEGLAGFVFQKEPTVDAPDELDPVVKDVTYTGVDLSTFALWTTTDVLTTGRYGVHVEMLDDESVTAIAEQRPYWRGYRAEDILNWRVERRGSDPAVLVRVVLYECVEEQKEGDPYVTIEVDQYRVLELVGEGDATQYQQSTWRKVKDKDEYVVHEAPKIAMRRGKPLTRIPFIFVGPTSLAVDVSKPPLLDLVEVNLSHYRTMADLEHGRHYVALPTPWVSGMRDQDDRAPLAVGPQTVWDLEKGGQAGMLEFTGNGLAALVTADTDKRKMMSVLGARLLEDQAAVAETATAVLMRHSGEGATLRKMTKVVSEALTQALRWTEWWLGTEDNVSDIESTVELNQEFFAIKLNPQELQAQLQLLQAGAISYETFYYNVTTGGWTRPGVDSKEEQEQIAREGGGSNVDDEDIEPLPEGEDQGLEVQPGEEEAAGPGMMAGDLVMHDEGPYKMVRRKGKYIVVKADNGEVMGEHATSTEAKKQLAALAISQRKEKTKRVGGR
jgi:hypothetical protein